jgi:hypothetical protein
MKKILIWLLIFTLSFWITKANDLDINANLESWEYEFVIEVNLNANDKNAKIFYYTDGEWRMDHIYEYKKWKPLILKNYTTLNYYAIWENYTETQIKENIYEFNYPKKFKISFKNNKIIIKNENSDIVNFWYFRVNWDNLDYEVDKNTFIEKWESFEVNYNWKIWEELKLFSPDNKEIISYKIQAEVKKEEIKVEDTKKEIVEINKDESIKTEENSQSWSVSETESWETTKDDNGETNNEVTQDIAIPTQESKIEENKEENIDLNEELKSSVTDKKNNSLTFIIYIFLFLVFWITAYNIVFVIRKKIKK